MVDPWQRSKRRSSGRPEERSKQRNPTFYLDENFDCPEVKEVLDRAGIRYRIYKQDVRANVGSEDTSFLPKVGKHGWLLITADWHQRTRPRESEDLRRYGVKHFALPGNLGAVQMAKILVQAKNDIRACARDHNGHVSANVLRNGCVNVIRDAQGSLYDRGETRAYCNGKLRTSAPVR
ncbi:MAG: hypothetical protein ACE14L_14795 [Terriglobales bacterium]